MSAMDISTFPFFIVEFCVLAVRALSEVDKLILILTKKNCVISKCGN